jgi:hypothetical protein
MLEPGLIRWLHTVDRVAMTSRCLHGLDWGGNRCRHFVISSATARYLSPLFPHGGAPISTAKLLARLPSLEQRELAA